jgi:hypothetical protein
MQMQRDIGTNRQAVGTARGPQGGRAPPLPPPPAGPPGLAALGRAGWQCSRRGAARGARTGPAWPPAAKSVMHCTVSFLGDYL